MFFLTNFQLHGITQEVSDSLNQEDKLGRQGLWKIYDRKGRIKKTGIYQDNSKIHEWKYYKYKGKRRYWIYYYDFSTGKKELKSIYYRSNYCGYKYERIDGKMRLTTHYNLSW